MSDDHDLSLDEAVAHVRKELELWRALPEAARNDRHERKLQSDLKELEQRQRNVEMAKQTLAGLPRQG